MFEKTLADLVKGIRSCKGDVSVYISQCMQEIKNELKATDPFVKAQAIRKLTYLNMQGYDMGWAAFHVVEVMSYERFAHKRIGYLAAGQSFTQATDVVLLCTNLFKKEFGSGNEFEVGLALNAMANICTTDLARDLLGDILALMNSHKPYVRKKATLILYKLFLRYPQGLRLSFDRLKERMEEPDVGVVSCSVNVICELANKKPKNYVGLAPQFFRLLTTSSNNWMLIKVVKLMSSLVPEEPRLARKLLDPLATIIQNTPAKSLLYECISTVTTALLYTQKSDGSQPRNVPAIVKLCNDHLRRYIEDPDQNLRYLGLVGLSNLMQSHPHVIAEHQQLILECLSVEDTTIRLRSLELLAGMVTPDNAPAIVQELLRHTLGADGVYRQELIVKILAVCSLNKYHNVQDFDWYIRVLCQLSKLPGKEASGAHGAEITRQLMDIAVRVKGIRAALVKHMIALLLDRGALQDAGAATTAQVLYAAGWIVGEFVLEYLEGDDDSDSDDSDAESDAEEARLDKLVDVVDVMLQPATAALPAAVQAVYMHNLLKLLMAAADRADEATLEGVAQTVLERLPAFVQSEHIEVQERACTLEHVVLGLGLGLAALTPEARADRVFAGAMIASADGRLAVLNGFFAEPLAPVGAKAQRKVPLPPGLDLDAPFAKDEAAFLAAGDVDAAPDDEVSFVHAKEAEYVAVGAATSSDESDGEDAKAALEKQYAEEQARLRQDPFYIKPSRSAQADSGVGGLLSALDKKSKKKTKAKKQRAIVLDDEMPEGGASSDDDGGRRKRRSSKEVDLAEVDLTVPLREDERVPDAHWQHRQVAADEPKVASGGGNGSWRAQGKKSKKPKEAKVKKSKKAVEDEPKKSKKSKKLKEDKPKKPKKSKKAADGGGALNDEPLLLF
ncbi:AP-3 complex subunit delta [Achlya hypogyna]|uniref:AP-3 complex subunit delta n=1 Tax=Achlya hypogyna TaxID=1202772 RepID=A0A1V9ZUU9_ACHHY|nr:AP-3 complex subunit delta [Achlya hypogyna]